MLGDKSESEGSNFVNYTAIGHDCFTTYANKINLVHDYSHSTIDDNLTGQSHLLALLSNVVPSVTWVTFSGDNVDFNTTFGDMFKHIQNSIAQAMN